MSLPEGVSAPLLPWRRVLDLLVISDVVMTALGLVLSHQARYLESLDTPFVHNAPVLSTWYMLPMGVVWLLSFRLFGLYERANLVSGIGEYRRISTAGLVTTLAVIVFAYVRVNPYMSRGLLLLSLITVVALVGLGRFWIRRYVYRQARHGRPLERVVVVGTSRHAIAAARQLTESPSSSSEVVGFLSDYRPKGMVMLSGRKVLGEPMELQEVAEKYGITRALVVESDLSWESLQTMVRLMHHRDGVAISLLPGLFDLHATQIVPQQLGPVLTLTPQPARIVGADAVMKRSLDLLLGIVAALIALPFMVLLAVLSLARGRGVGMRSERVLGPRGPFNLWRFDGPEWARQAHLTRVPNLIFVLGGSMSLLGPRPVALHRAEAYSEAMEFLDLAKPGFIGPWWLVGKAEPDDIPDELGYDLHYLRNYSVWLDLHILLQVARSLVGARPGTNVKLAGKPLVTTRRDSGPDAVGAAKL